MQSSTGRLGLQCSGGSWAGVEVAGGRPHPVVGEFDHSRRVRVVKLAVTGGRSGGRSGGQRRGELHPANDELD